MTTEELVVELNRLRSLAHALTQEIERLQRKVDPHGTPPARHSVAPPGGTAKKVPSLQIPAVRSSRPPKR